MIIKQSAAQKETLKLDNLISELINKNYLVFIKKGILLSLLLGKIKKKTKKRQGSNVIIIIKWDIKKLIISINTRRRPYSTENLRRIEFKEREIK